MEDARNCGGGVCSESKEAEQGNQLPRVFQSAALFTVVSAPVTMISDGIE